MKVTAIIPAAGEGKRLNAKKQFIELLGKPLLLTTASVFEECQAVDEIIVVVGEKDIELAKDILKSLKKVKSVIAGGVKRQDSVYNGLKEVVRETEDDLVLIHDAARPLITREIVASAIDEAKVSGAAVVGVPAKDTVKTVDEARNVIETLEREKIWLVQTPQVFRYDLIKEAHERASRVKYTATDDSKLVERLGISVKMVMGSYENFKITTKEDIVTAEAVLKERGE